MNHEHREGAVRVNAEHACDDVERVARFIVEEVHRRHGRCAYQGPWPASLVGRESLHHLTNSVRVLAEQRFKQVPRAVARALLLWAAGAQVSLFDHVPAAHTVLALQARGARCVSLLPDHVSPAPHADTLAFALHDLCHLDKFLIPEHHVGQVGFFSMVAGVRGSPPWMRFEGEFDSELSEQWDHVLSDMNGSAVFLFAAMKMKLKMAVRRRAAGARGTPAREGGSLSHDESLAYDQAERQLLELFDLRGELASFAQQTSAKRTEPRAAQELLRYFEWLGRAALYGRSGNA